MRSRQGVSLQSKENGVQKIMQLLPDNIAFYGIISCEVASYLGDETRKDFLTDLDVFNADGVE